MSEIGYSAKKDGKPIRILAYVGTLHPKVETYLIASDRVSLKLLCTSNGR
jgi:hypothetical protein